MYQNWPYTIWFITKIYYREKVWNAFHISNALEWHLLFSSIFLIKYWYLILWRHGDNQQPKYTIPFLYLQLGISGLFLREQILNTTLSTILTFSFSHSRSSFEILFLCVIIKQQIYWLLPSSINIPFYCRHHQGELFVTQNSILSPLDDDTFHEMLLMTKHSISNKLRKNKGQKYCIGITIIYHNAW